MLDSQQSLSSTSGPYRCPHCERSYDRQDYLARHLDSHSNKRSFRCEICNRGFNRRDVLQRHQTLHDNLSADDEMIIRRRKDRLPGAIAECGSKPVEQERSSKRQQQSRSQIRLDEISGIAPETTTHTFPQQEISNVRQCSTDVVSLDPPLGMGRESFSTAPANPVPPNTDLGSADPSSHPPTVDPNLIIHQNKSPELSFQTSPNGCPAFFEHVMLLGPGGAQTGHDFHQPCPNTFDILPDLDLEISDNGLFGENFIPDLEQIVLHDFLLPLQMREDGNNPEPGYLDSTKKRVDAFQRSFWNILQHNTQNTINEDDHSFDGSELETPVLSPHFIPSNLTVHDKLSSRSRDEIFRLIVKTGDDRLSIPEIPTVDHLDILIKIGLAKKLDVNPWIHLYTSYRDNPRPELLVALVATGCISCLVPTINKTGIIMQEIVRVALRNLSNADVGVTRDLQYLQASMIWLEIGFSCGYRRNMRMTEGAIQALGIALRQMGAFDSSSYKPINPFGIPDDDSVGLDHTWKQWIEQESLKRLVYHFFCHDIEVSAAMNQPPTTSFAELTLSIPAARDLWLAPTANAWKATWTTRYQSPRPEISLRDLLSDPGLLKDLPMHFDSRVATSALLHGLIGKVWDVRQQMLLDRRSLSRQPARKLLLLQSRQEDLYTDLQKIQNDLADSPPVTFLLSEFAVMYLHIDVDALQRFAGKLGEEEARQTYPDLRDWSMTQDARIAVWHAGQVFRAVHRVGPYQLRGFDIFAIYYASLTLYVYGLLLCAEKKPSGAVDSWDIGDPSLVLLDGPSSRATEAFIAHDRGQPGLTYMTGSNVQAQETFCSLRQPRLVMRVALQVLNSNFSKFSSADPAKNPIPPLVMNLRGLLHDLANLQ